MHFFKIKREFSMIMCESSVLVMGFPNMARKSLLAILHGVLKTSVCYDGAVNKKP